ncbi:MAG TPA: hypothetical protein DCG75_02390 [Bacteroidales bacterium]|nr:hypothetical protein [Bacteroidales bacterium]
MEYNAKQFETLAERTTEYVKTSYDLVKLKVVDKISDIVSSLIPHSVVFVIIAIFLLFCNLGIVFWLGELLGKIYLGFFIVAAFYGFLGIIMLFMHKWFKKNIYNKIIKQLLK